VVRRARSLRFDHERRHRLDEEHEVRYWTQKFGCSKEQLEEAVREVGPMADDVGRRLGK
jgi:hypothetical protein